MTATFFAAGAELVGEDQSKPKKPRKVDPAAKIIPTSVLLRALEKSNEEELEWEKNRLYASQVCDTYWDLKKELLRFWTPPELEKLNFASQYRMDSGNLMHELIQRHLSNNIFGEELLHPICFQDGKFQEPYCQWGFENSIGGRIDLILPDGKFLKDLDKQKEDRNIEYWQTCDIKQTTTSEFDRMCDGVLSQKFRGQLSIYIDWFQKHHNGPDVGCFLYCDRNDPKRMKLFETKKEESLLTIAQERSKMFVEHVRERKIPDMSQEDSKKFVKDCISAQPKRRWSPFCFPNFGK
jgi:hypothetical protein